MRMPVLYLSGALLIPLFFSCLKKDNEENQPGPGMTESGKEANLLEATSHNLLTVEVGTPIDQLNIHQRDLHGKFFQERAWFYVIEAPELYLSDTEVTELTLYFVDGVLCKKKYLIADDISEELMKSYGGFTFRSLNHRTREVAKTEEIVLKTSDGNVLNENLNRCVMKWDQDEILIQYYLQRDSLNSVFYLEEELSIYRHLLAEAKSGVI